MYKFSDKKNREDVIALRWPKACLTCGSEKVEESDARYAILGKFHVVKKTQVLIKLPGYFYMCECCRELIQSFIKKFQKSEDKQIKLAENLLDAPWNQLLELEKNGCVKLPRGQFRNKIKELNPEGCIKEKTDPMEILNQSFKKK